MNANEFEALKAGYVRGLLAMPLATGDVGLSRDQLIAKYAPQLIAKGELQPGNGQ